MILGAVLRLLRLGEQVLGGDELHAVRAALTEPVGVLLTTYQAADPCLPLAAFYRLLMDLGVRPSEWTFRLPVLLFALATPLLLPLLALRAGWLERRAAVLLAWLLALSPLLVLYGRIVRPYGMVVLVVLTALVAFDRFRTSTGRRSRLGWGALYAGCAALALYLHLATGPILAAPFLFTVGEAVAMRRKGGWLPLLALGAGTALLGAAFLLPAWDSFRALMESKGGTGRPGWAAVEGTLLLLPGTRFPPVAALFWGVAAAGCALLIRERRRLGLYLLTAVVGHGVGLLLLAPFGIESPAVLARYLLVALPILLLWVAHALGRIGQRGLAGGPVVAGALVLGLFLSTPLSRPGWWDSSFLHHADTLRFDRPQPTVAAADLPPMYRTLADLPPGPIVEAPVRTSWRFARAVPAYQRHHRRRVLLLSDDPQLCDPRLALHNHVCPNPESIRQSDAVAILVHLDPVAEEERLDGPPPARDRREEQTRRRLAAQGGRLQARMEAAFGPPVAAQEETMGLWIVNSTVPMHEVTP